MRRNPLEAVSDLMMTLSVIPVLAMIAHVTLDVFLKYVFSSPIQGTLEITAYYYMVAIVVLPIAFVELTQKSIFVEMFYQLLPRSIQVVAIGFVLLICAVGYGGLAYISWPDALRAVEIKEIIMGTVNLPIWPARFLLPIALTVTALICLMHFWRLCTDSEAREKLVAIYEVNPDTEVD